MVVGDRCDIFVFIGRHFAMLIMSVIVIAVNAVFKTVKIAIVLLISIITMTDLATRLLEVHKQKGLLQQQVAEIAGVHFTNVGKYERAEKNLMQIEVATYIGVDKSAYGKIEKGLRALTVDELQKMAQLFNLTTDQIINYDGKIPT